MKVVSWIIALVGACVFILVEYGIAAFLLESSLETIFNRDINFGALFLLVATIMIFFKPSSSAKGSK